MVIYTVKAPFVCREGQFKPGERAVCIGLDMKALKSTDIYRCYMGKNRETYYEIDTAKAIEFALYHNSVWKNPRGRLTAILPLTEFTTHKLKPSANEVATMVTKSKPVQIDLFGLKGGER